MIKKREFSLPACDHSHTRNQVPNHLVGGAAHPVLVMVQAEVLLYNLFTGCDRYLDGALDDRGHEFGHGLLNSQLDQFKHLRMLLKNILF